MADTSVTFKPADVATSSDAASDALSKCAVVSDAASNAQSKITARSATWDTKTVILKPVAEGTALATVDDIMRFTVPGAFNGMNLVSCGAHVYTSATSGTVTIDIYNVTSGVDMLTSAMTIDATEGDTATATSAAVINTGADGVATGEELRIDVTAAGSGASGLEVRLGFRTP